MMRVKSTAVALSVLISALLIAAVHLTYGAWVGLHLYQLAGGIVRESSGWTRFGGAPFAWAIPLQLPGTLLLGCSCETLGRDSNAIAISLVLAASIAVGYAAASLAASFILKKRRPPLYLDWRVLTIILGMIWIPVPETLALVYYHTVKY